MSSFFTLPPSQRKRKRPTANAENPVKRRGVERRPTQDERKIPRSRQRDESISGSYSEVGDDAELQSGEESEGATSEENETAPERRIRLAQRYLDNIRQEVDETGFDAEDVDRDLIAQRLKADVDEAKGRQFRLIAQNLDFRNAAHCTFRLDTQATTAVAVCQPFAYTVSKDKTLVKWRLQQPSHAGPQNNGNVKKQKTGPPLKKQPQLLEYVIGVKKRWSEDRQYGHTGAILSVAASPDGQFVATGGADKKLIIWSAADLRPLKTFTVHRDAVTGLSFSHIISSQPGTGSQLFSASMDRSIKTYSLASEDSLACVETLFGHQDHVVAVSAMTVDQCVSVGARDRSARLWRVVDETQLKFVGDSSKSEVYQTGTLDCVAALPPHHFVTGSDSGALSLWSIHKKKPLLTIQTAHGVDDLPPFEDITAESNPEEIEELKKIDWRKPLPRAITALVALPGTDVVLSGSWDGWIRVWKISDDKRSLISLGVLGSTEKQARPNGHANGSSDHNELSSVADMTSSIQQAGPVKGVVNSLAMFERRKQTHSEFGGTKEGECEGICVVAGTGKEMRLGRWMKFPQGKNGAMVFEVPVVGQRDAVE